MLVNRFGVSISEAVSIAPPTGDYIQFTDSDGVRISIKLSTVARLMDLARFEFERAGKNFDEHISALIEAEDTRRRL